MDLVDLGLSAPMAAVRVMVEVRDLHQKVGLVMGIILMYNIAYVVGSLG